MSVILTPSRCLLANPPVTPYHALSPVAHRPPISRGPSHILQNEISISLANIYKCNSQKLTKNTIISLLFSVKERYQGYALPSQSQNVATPTLSLPRSSFPPFPFSSMTFSIPFTDSSGVIIPSTSHAKSTFEAMSVATSPGCRASTTVWELGCFDESSEPGPLTVPAFAGLVMPAPLPAALTAFAGLASLGSSAAKCLRPWFSAALLAA
jgi:hypothetical protein